MDILTVLLLMTMCIVIGFMFGITLGIIIGLEIKRRS